METIDDFPHAPVAKSCKGEKHRVVTIPKKGLSFLLSTEVIKLFRQIEPTFDDNKSWHYRKAVETGYNTLKPLINAIADIKHGPTTHIENFGILPFERKQIEEVARLLGIEQNSEAIRFMIYISLLINYKDQLAAFQPKSEPLLPKGWIKIGEKMVKVRPTGESKHD